MGAQGRTGLSIKNSPPLERKSSLGPRKRQVITPNISQSWPGPTFGVSVPASSKCGQCSSQKGKKCSQCLLMQGSNSQYQEQWSIVSINNTTRRVQKYNPSLALLVPKEHYPWSLLFIHWPLNPPRCHHSRRMMYLSQTKLLRMMIVLATHNSTLRLLIVLARQVR